MSRLKYLIHEATRWSDLLLHHRDAIASAEERYNLVFTQSRQAQKALCDYYKKYGTWACIAWMEDSKEISGSESGTYEEALAAGRAILVSLDKGHGYSPYEEPGNINLLIIREVDHLGTKYLSGDSQVTLICIDQEEMNRAALTDEL